MWWSRALYSVVLNYLLAGSEDLWGTIDWEAGRCDFSGDLFTKILEITKRYADPESIRQTAVADRYRLDVDVREVVESNRRVILDYPFNDGWYPYFSVSDVLMVNANTKYPEGACEFIEYLLDEEGQTFVTQSSGLPVNKDMADSYKAWELKENEAEKSHYYMTIDGVPEEISLTKEMTDEALDYAERTRYLPLKTKEIQSIIYEEALLFYTGDKSLEAVIDLIQNRVQLYLDENM